MYKGIVVSEGIAIGKAFVINRDNININKETVQDCELEVKRLEQAVEKSAAQLEVLVDSIDGKIDSNEIDIIKTQIVVLSDPDLFRHMKEEIRQNNVVAQYAVNKIMRQYIKLFDDANDYLKERTDDILDVGSRIVNNLMDITLPDYSNIDEGVIIVSSYLNPTDVIQFDTSKVLGLAVERGGKTSHTSILAKSMGIPALVGVNNMLNDLKSGDTIVLDGKKGHIILRPNDKLLSHYSQIESKSRQLYDNASAYTEVKYKDSSKLSLMANIFATSQCNEVITYNAEGIGLLRTEFMYMNKKTLPTEESQYHEYTNIIKKVGNSPVTIRILDVGNDKSFPQITMPNEQNPSLGFRGVRVLFEYKEVLAEQIRALLRAAVHGKMRIMFPMVTSVEEVIELKSIISTQRKILTQRGIKYGDVKIGIMIETPATAIMSDILANYVDFFSIGTNDLMQYIQAADRTNPKVETMLNPFYPAVIRMLRLVVQNAHKRGIPVSVCGEIASDIKSLPLLVGLGVDELSMHPRLLPEARMLLANISTLDCKRKVAKAVKLDTIKDVKDVFGL